jgi:NAD(P)-dependent dehydrogenase (short-subunit alcohol dehydrogenase family)
MVELDRRELDGHVAIVTGAGAQGSGIGNGRAAAVLLARAGARVVLVDLDKARLQGTIDLIEEFGGTSLAVTGDVSQENDCSRIVSKAVDAWGRLDILVNNVGVVGPAESVVDGSPSRICSNNAPGRSSTSPRSQAFSPTHGRRMRPRRAPSSA